MTDVERLFRTYHATLVHYLTRRLGDRDWAEEVAQETFVRALRQGALSSERAWLFTVANNLVRDEARRNVRQRQHLSLLRDEQVSDGELNDTTDDADEADEAQALQRIAARKAVDALGERDRMALLLREEGLDYAEIAEALELSVHSIGTTLSRARRRLVEMYEELQLGAAGRKSNG